MLVLFTGAIASGFIYINTALTGLLLFAFAFFAFHSAWSEGRLPRLPLSIWMAIYLVWLGVVTVSSSAPNASFLTGWVLAGMPLAYLGWSALPNPDMTWARLRALFWLGGIGMAAWGIWQVVQPGGRGQAVGPLIDRNAFAALINILWFSAAYVFLNGSIFKSRNLPMLGAGLFVMSIGLFVTESRGGIGAWLLLLPLLLWAGYRNPSTRRRVLMIPVIALAAYLLSAQLAGTSVANRGFDLANDANSVARLLMWKSSVLMTLAHPLAGTGWGTFAAYYPAFRSPLENTTSGLYAHNDYLQLAAEGGMPALVLQLGVLLGLLLQLRRSLGRVSGPAGLESVALSLGALALFVHAGVNFIFYFAFMNILAGLYLARAAQLVEPTRCFVLPNFDQIGRPFKYLLAGFIPLLFAAPLLVHLSAQLCLTGTQPGLKAINLIAPSITTYDIAKLISALRPQEGIAQEVMLRSVENALKSSDGVQMKGGNFQRRLLLEALDRFDYVRAQTANSPNVGVREVKVLLANRNSLGDDIAYARARQVLDDNLAANPYHAYSMIYLARLDVLTAHAGAAMEFLRRSQGHVLSRRDQQLLSVEMLRQLAAPKVIAELDNIEEQLRKIRSESEVGKVMAFSPEASEAIDARLNAIGAQLRASHSQVL